MNNAQGIIQWNICDMHLGSEELVSVDKREQNIQNQNDFQNEVASHTSHTSDTAIQPTKLHPDHRQPVLSAENELNSSICKSISTGVSVVRVKIAIYSKQNCNILK